MSHQTRDIRSDVIIHAHDPIRVLPARCRHGFGLLYEIDNLAVHSLDLSLGVAYHLFVILVEALLKSVD